VPDRSAARIAATVAKKAQGIFLWVAIVTKAMRHQLESGTGPDTLTDLLDTLPDELDSLYEYVLKSLSWADRRKAYRTLAVLEVLTKYDMRLSLLAYSFFDEYEADGDFAVRGFFPPQVAAGPKKKRADLACKCLNGRCMGLVEVEAEAVLVISTTRIGLSPSSSRTGG
jgi:hypothetical protein